MKQKNTSLARSKKLLLLLLSIFVFNQAEAQTEKKRTVEKVFDGKTALWVSHRYGDLLLRRSNNTQTKVVLTITAQGKNESELQNFLNQFDIATNEAPDNKLDVQTSHQIDNWMNITGYRIIKLKNGQKFHGVKDFNLKLEIFVPKLQYATLENKYANIRTEDGTAAILEAILFDGELQMMGNYEHLKLDIKYGSGTLGNFSTAVAELYDSNISFGDGKKMDIQSKYSAVKLGNLETLSLDCFDDNYKIGGVSSQLMLRDKYSQFRFTGNWGNANCQFYDSQVEGLNANQVQITESHYTAFSFQELNSLHFDISFDNVVKITKAGTLSASDSKYTKYQVGGLWKNLLMRESFDDDIKILKVGSTFEGLNFNGKYTELTIPIPSPVKYELSAEMKYSKLTYPSNELESVYHKEREEEIVIKGKIKGAGANAPKVEVTSFDGDIILK
jgi:hypothetical protein